MPKLFIMIGLSGSGKSTYAKQIAEEENAVILSSDAIRFEMLGSEDNQDKNAEVFQELNKRLILNLKNGNNVVYDATNLSSRRRKSLINNLKIESLEVYAKVVNTLIELCIERDSGRDRSVGVGVIMSQRMKFNFPLDNEGFNGIDLLLYDKKGHNINRLYFLNEMSGFEQDNKNHSMDLLHHCTEASVLYIENSDVFLREIEVALLLHDIGKLYTKSFKNSKGETSSDAHYYGHENVSAYEYMTKLIRENDKKDFTFTVIRLINYHMLPYSYKDNKQKFIKKVGEELYEMLMVVNKYDKMAH